MILGFRFGLRVYLGYSILLILRSLDCWIPFMSGLLGQEGLRTGPVTTQLPKVHLESPRLLRAKPEQKSWKAKPYKP